MNFLNKLKNSKLSCDAFWAVVGNALGYGLSIVTGILLARILAKFEYGEYGVIKNTLVLITGFSTFGLQYTSTKFIAQYKDTNKSMVLAVHRIALNITKIFSVVLALLVCLFANQLASFLGDEKLSTPLLLMSIALFFNALATTIVGELGGFKAYKDIAINSMYSGITLIVLSIPLSIYFRLNGAVLGLIISYIVNCYFNLRSIKKYIEPYKLEGTVKITKSETLQVVNFSLPVVLQESLYSISHWSITAILARLSDFGEIGLYSAAVVWSAVLAYIPSTLRNVALSYFSSTSSKGVFKTLLKINLLSTVIPFIILSLFSSLLCSLYGPSYEGLQAVLIICLAGAVVISVTNVLSSELMARGDNWYLFFIRVVRDLFIVIVLYYLLVNNICTGALAASLSSLLAQVVYLIALILRCRKIVKRV